MTKNMPIGICSFDGIIDWDYYYVDKTDAIRRMMEIGSKVYLYTRPRRFGKSLMLSTIDCFFNMKYEGNTWFDGLKVSECSECDIHKNAYPVIKMDFKGLGEDYDTILHSMKAMVANLFMSFAKDLRPCLDEVNLGRYDQLYGAKSDEAALRQSVLFLSILLKEHYGRKVVILIDEYDDPIHKTYRTPDSQKVLGFMRSMLSAALKGNDSLWFGVLAGVVPIADLVFSSGLNNIRVDGVFDEGFADAFGFTDDEVRAICGCYAESEGRDADEAFAEAKEWYDGYTFGNKTVYNPWSILKYVSTGFEPDTYWIDTSGNAIIGDLIDAADDADWRDIVKLSDGGWIPTIVPRSVRLSDMDRRWGIYPVMAMSGYLKASTEGGDRLLSVPNKEVRREFGRIIARRIAADTINVKGFIRAMVSGDAATMEEKLGDILMDNIGGLAFDSERSYNMAISCILIDRDGALSVASEKESGNGRPDIALKSRRAGTPNIIMELKKADPSSSGEGAMRLAEEAIRQIHDKRYYHGMRGDTILYGISFTGRIPHIAMERISL